LNKEEKRDYNIAYCRSHKKEAAAYRRKNKDKIAAAKVIYNKNNKEKIAAYEATYREENKERISTQRAAYRVDHKDEISDYNAEYYSKHSDEIKANASAWRLENEGYQAAYYEAHKEEKAAYGAEWYANNRDARREWVLNNMDKRRATDSKRRALIAGATIGDLDEIEEIYRQAVEDEGIICYLCGEVIEKNCGQVDHIFPVSKGGVHSAENLRIVHAHCNLKKSAKIIDAEALIEKNIPNTETI